STSTAGWTASSPWRTWRRSWSGRSATRSTGRNRARSASGTGPGWYRPGCASTRWPTPPGSSCRPRRTTTPCPGWSCGGWAGWQGSGTRWRWTACGCGWWRCTGRSHARCGSRRERGGGTGGHVSTAWALVLSALLLAGNAFFVAAEFALVASRRYRLEHAAADGSRAARAAVAGSRELSLMLAGAQLGITACTLGLGALAEPTVEHLLHPLLSAAGLPERTGTVVAFVVALLVVSFLHVVVGEMAPKSWAITHPERSALL